MSKSYFALILGIFYLLIGLVLRLDVPTDTATAV